MRGLWGEEFTGVPERVLTTMSTNIPSSSEELLCRYYQIFSFQSKEKCNILVLMKTVGFLQKSPKSGFTDFPARVMLSIFEALKIIETLIKFYNSAVTERKES